MNLGQALTLAALLISTGLTQTAPGQRRSGRAQARPSKPAASQPSARGRAADPNADKYWAAQRNIEAAIQQLEAYLREHPDGERAATARQQLEALRGLSLAASRPEWARMGPKYLRDAPEWRVTSVNAQPDKLGLTVEVACKRDDGGDCYFDAFDRSPLVLVDNAGRYHPMLEAGDLPPDVRFEDGRRAAISGGRIIAVRVDFAPPAVSATSGQIYYRDNNRAQPARFSLTRPR